MVILKTTLLCALFFFSVARAGAACPDLTGEYVCSKAEGEERSFFSRSVDGEGVVIYTLVSVLFREGRVRSTRESFVIDGTMDYDGKRSYCDSGRLVVRAYTLWRSFGVMEGDVLVKRTSSGAGTDKVEYCTRVIQHQGEAHQATQK